VHALRRIHAALLPGGTVVDTQPVSPEPRVDAGDGRLGTLDMREWRRTIDAVENETARALEDGLFVIASEHMIEVADEFDTGAEFIEVVGAWRGTRIPPALIERASAARPPVRVPQAIRLRLLRSLPYG
jgi:hypothetical protein